MVTSRRAVFLDRDGVITVPEFRDGRSFAPRRLEELHYYDDAAESLRRLKAAGFALVVVTNQPDVGNGLVAREVVEEMHRRMIAAFPLDAIEACFHGQAEGCACRKPKPGMLTSAAARLGLDTRASFMVGDRDSDMLAGRAAGCATVFVDRGYADEPRHGPDCVVAGLREATEFILNQR